MGEPLEANEYNYAVKMVKQAIMGHISTTISMRKLSQNEAADLLDVNQPQISLIACGRHERFSIDYLVKICRQLGYGVELNFYPIDPRGH